jgi:hypothetical protein
MADDSTDTAFGFIVFILFLALLGAAASGTLPSSGTTTTTTAPRPTATYTTPSTTSATNSNIPGGPLKSCPGKLIANKTASSSDGKVNLKIYFSSVDGDQNCAVGTAYGWPSKMQGSLRVSLGFSDYNGNQWPQYAWASSQPHTTSIGGVYLTDTYNRCIVGTATYTPFTGMRPVTARIGPTGCN